MPHIITEPCIGVKDQSCVDVCPVECIYEADDQLYIHPDECIDCAACEPVCPVDAIYFEDDVPEEYSEYTQANADFFATVGSPGGAEQVGKIDRDVPPISDLPPQA